MMLSPDGPPALPLWINGRAFLTLVQSFFEVRDALTGEPLRRTPLCGADEVAEAVLAAGAAAPAWAARERDARAALLTAWAAGLEQYSGHFAKLLRQETGQDEAEAQAEVARTVAFLRQAGISADAADAGQVVALAWDDAAPLAQAAQLLVPVLQAGGTVVLKPTPKAPGAAYALVELSARVGLPAGVVNLVQGDDAALAALCGHPDIARLGFAGRPELAARVAERAAQAGKPCQLST
ncbi:aldehyde dehydrogenase family protein [Azovibrio restrictus]|uniref:aldehyde dehydrogenase family protein n=1 Tax=Azovibrio restrictus TaxID=146938 RepID=UPI0026EAD957|nr:aldehyde dehydrogenase family protein [Azovibrio restrictus]MDD3482192.1 aldehyde dehydrogenase family protein [Azovibrio restrictus]